MLLSFPLPTIHKTLYQMNFTCFQKVNLLFKDKDFYLENIQNMWYSVWRQIVPKEELSDVLQTDSTL